MGKNLKIILITSGIIFLCFVVYIFMIFFHVNDELFNNHYYGAGCSLKNSILSYSPNIECIKKEISYCKILKKEDFGSCNKDIDCSIKDVSYDNSGKIANISQLGSVEAIMTFFSEGICPYHGILDLRIPWYPEPGLSQIKCLKNKCIRVFNPDLKYFEALDKNNITICEESNIRNEVDCKETIKQNKTNPIVCEGLNEYNKSRCLDQRTEAFLSLNVSMCPSSEYLNRDCITYIAIATSNESMCNLLTKYKDNCIMETKALSIINHSSG